MDRKLRELTQEYLKEILDYDPDTGVFIWLISPAWGVKVGDVAGTKNHHGYICISIDYRKYMAHRLAYLCMVGKWPKANLDHIDQNKINNSWDNLRECSKSNNSANRAKNKNNTSGYKGVSWHKPTEKWISQIGYNRKRIHLGLFTCKHEAAKAYNKKALELFGKFADLNKIDAP